MCEALRELMKDEIDVIIEESREKGMEMGMEKGMEKGIEEGLKKAVTALKGILDPVVIAEQFKMSLEQVMDILGQK